MGRWEPAYSGDTQLAAGYIVMMPLLIPIMVVPYAMRRSRAKIREIPFCGSHTFCGRRRRVKLHFNRYCYDTPY